MAGKPSRRSEKRRKNKTDEPRWPVTFKWVAMGTLVAYTAIGSQTIQVTQAQERPQDYPRSSRSEARTALPERRFEIPPGPLDEVLGSFEKTNGLRVLVPNEALRKILSPGVSGVYTDEQAMSRILAGTGVTYRFVSAGILRLDLASVSESVTVTGDSESVSLAKLPMGPLDTPQTINVVPQKIMQEEGTTTLRDALRNVAGISLAAGEGGAQGDNLTIRGFTARNDIFLDGMRDFGSYYRDPFDMESVAVLQGPSSVLFGRGSTGGVVSQTTKTPHLEPTVGGTVTFGTDGTRRLTMDMDEPVTALGDKTAFRLNLMGNDSQVAGRNIALNRRYGIAPAITFGVGTPTRLTFSYLRLWEDDKPDYGVPWFFNQPAKVPRNNYYGFENGNYLKTDANVGTAKLEHDFSGTMTLRSQLRYANYNREALITEPQIPTGVTHTTPLSNIAVTRHEIAVNSVESFLDEQTDVVALFHTGAVRHTFVAGVEAGRETSDPVRPTYTNVPSTPLLAPNPYEAPSGAETITSIVHTTAYTAAAYALDTISLGSKVELTGGVRWDRFSTDYSQSVAPASAFNRVDEMPSWRGAIVYKPKSNASIYFDYGTSFNPSAETLALSAASANTPPEKNKTYELGSKWDLPNRRLTLQAAIFRTDKTNAREPDPNNPLLNVLGGNQRVDGAQIQLSGHLTSRWEILSSYAYLHSEVVSSKFYPASVGYPLANVPQNTFNLWTTYELPWQGLEFGAGENFVDWRTASSTLPLDPTTRLLKQVPSYWVSNAMGRYRLAEWMDIQVNVYNLADRYYYDEPHPAHVIPGAGRSATASLNFRLPNGKGQ